MSRMKHGWVLTVAACCLGTHGCSQAPDDGPEKLVPVSGMVSVDGDAAEGVALSFQPVAGTAGTGGFAATDLTGSFKVVHRSGQEGIEPGSYTVTASRVLTPEGNPVPSGESAMDHNAEETLPAKYLDSETTPFRVEVTDGMAPISLEIEPK
jgi:hypothetical protein